MSGKKISLGLGLFSSLLCLSLTQTMTVEAAPAGLANTEGKVQFSEDTSTGVPIDPTEPGTEVTPDVPGGSTTGPLRIDYVSNFDFGEQMISGSTKTYHSKKIKITQNTSSTEKYVPEYLQVTDNRGTNSGWHLTASRSEFSDGTDQMTGTQLKIENSEKVSAVSPQLPTSDDPIEMKNFEIPIGTDADVIYAEAGKGMSTWIHSFGPIGETAAVEENPSVLLTIPANSKKNKTDYKSTITWTLTDAP